MAKVVHQSHDMRAAWMRLGRRRYSLEELDFVQRGLGVVTIRFHDLESDVTIATASESVRSARRLVLIVSSDIRVIPRQPHSREVTPSKLADNHVATIVEVITNVDGMITTNAVVFKIFLVFGEDRGRDRRRPCGSRGLGGGRLRLSRHGHRWNCGALCWGQLSKRGRWMAGSRRSR